MPTRPALAIAQSGGPTPVVNASLVGALLAGRAARRADRILGVRFGIEGALRNEYVDLTDLSESECASLAMTPNAALGSSRYRPSDAELAQIARNLQAREVGWLVMIGGNDSADTLHRIHHTASTLGVPLAVVGIPKTIDNDLPHMDHCPGYGSAARYIALATREAALDTSAMRRTDPIKVVEVMGRNAGWLAAAAALGRTQPAGGPQIIFFPERPRGLPQMLAEIREVYERDGWAVIVVCENQRDDSGRPLGSDVPVYVDPHGHPYFEGAGAHLARVTQAELGLRTRYDRPGSLQRSSASALSSVDVEEARSAGAEAVRRARAGESDVMVAIQRSPGASYAAYFTAIPLDHVAHHERMMPNDFIAPSGTDVTQAFYEYARPLIGEPLPPVVQLL